jgi:hypothetical protein
MTEKLLSEQGKKRMYFASMGLSVSDGLALHRLSGQLQRGQDSWRNVTEHCLAEVARVDVLARWIRLPEAMIREIKMGSFLHDFDKKQEIIATKNADKQGESPLIAARVEQEKGDTLLADDGFSNRVIRFASSAGGDAPQLIEVQNILNQTNLSDSDWAYLLVHYVDDCSVGSDWVRPKDDNRRVNIIDYRAEENKAKKTYTKISMEIGEKLIGTPFEGMNNHDAMSLVSHQIERRLAQRILERTGEVVDPLDIPEKVDQKIRESIEQMYV